MMQSKLIKNRARAQQILAFDGMNYGKCRPSDLDMSIDFQGRSFVFVEVKGEGVQMPAGQRFHLEGLVRAIRKGGLVAYAILAAHQTKVTEDVHVAQCRVVAVYDGNLWGKLDTNERLDDRIAQIHEEHLERKV